MPVERLTVISIPYGSTKGKKSDIYDVYQIVFQFLMVRLKAVAKRKRLNSKSICCLL